MNVRVLRKARGLTILRLAQLCGMDPSRLWRVEHGHACATVNELAALSAALQPAPLSVADVDALGAAFGEELTRQCAEFRFDLERRGLAPKQVDRALKAVARRLGGKQRRKALDPAITVGSTSEKNRTNR